MRRASWRVVWLALALAAWVHAGDEDPGADARRQRQARELLVMFDVAEVPLCRDRKFVKYDTGGRWRTQGGPLKVSWGWGWLSKTSPGRIKVLDFTLLDGFVYQRGTNEPEKGLPAGCHTYDFERFCAEFLAEGPDPNWFDLRYAKTDVPRALQACALARWARHREMPQTASRLFQLARESHRRLDQAKPFEQYIAAALGDVLKKRAWADADAAPRRELLAAWRRIRRILPKDEYVAARVAGYERLIAEDEAWTEPDPRERARWTPVEQALYWAHHLRDSRLQRVGGGRFLPTTTHWGEAEDPARKLVGLGWQAIPVLLLLWDDPRPTRGAMTFGDCTGIILAQITTEWFATRDEANAWWRTALLKGPEAHYLAKLESPYPSTQNRAAAWLLKLNPRAHLLAILKKVRTARDHHAGNLLHLLRPHLDGSHRNFLLEAFRSRNWYTKVAAAWLLWLCCQDDRGVRELCKRLLRDASRGSIAWMESSTALGMVATVPRDFVVETVCRLIAHPNVRVREYAVPGARRCVHPRVLDKLLLALTDKADAGSVNSFSIRICDDAAFAIAGMVRYPPGFERARKVGERDRQIEQLVQWVHKHRASFDWSALRRPVEARR